ncbi:MAG: NAD(P)-dependent alcohol dehydrogenase [Desulfobacteraceae bacterium]|jgi:NADPH:quinone reductase-like Zn-dependent oxidoreductase|nr:NAD(P)-dependent alcohol dehydrogenase [Desulfobacteraceae bacterium]
MKAIVYEKYGPPDVLQLKEVEKPIPKEDEALVKVHAASVNAADLEILRGTWAARFGGPLRPQHKIPGSDLAGRVEAVGSNVKQLQPGDEIWGDLSFPYGYGTFAEYVCVSENALVMKPASMTFEEASTYPQSAIISLQSLRDKGQIQPGQKVLINGAGGGMGTFAVQLAKYYGAEVTGVDSASKLNMLRSIGADHVIDYAQEDYTKSGQRYDLILDVVAYRSVFDYRRALSPEGIFLIVGGSLATFLQVLILGALISRMGSKKLGPNAYEPNNKEDLAFLAELFESGDVVPFIDRRYPLSEVPEAIRYLEEEPHLGKIVITMDHNNKT